MRSIQCKCEHKIDTALPESINLDASPEYIDQILQGHFFEVACPHCGLLLKPELDVRLSSRSKSIDVFQIPEIDRYRWYSGTKTGVPTETDVLIGFPELYERMSIISQGLDFQVIEMIKFSLFTRAIADYPESDVVILFSKKQDSKLVFHVSGIREDEIAVLAVPEKVYNNLLVSKNEQLKKDPFPDMFKSQYKSLRVLESDIGDADNNDR